MWPLKTDSMSCCMQLLLVISMSGAVPLHRQWLEVRKWLQEKKAKKCTEKNWISRC